MNFEFLLRVRDLEQCVVENNVADNLRGRQNLPQPAVPAALAATQYGEINVLPRRQTRDIGFGNQRPNSHGVQLSDAQDSRSLLSRVQRLTFQRTDRYHLTVHGSDDACIGEIGLRGLELGPGLLDLRLERLQCGVRQFVIGLCDFRLASRLCPLTRQVIAARFLQTGELKLRFLAFPLSLKICQRRSCLGHFRGADQRVYFRQ